MDLHHFCSKEDFFFFFEGSAGDMGGVEEGNRLVISGCPLLLRNIPIFIIYICIFWGLESLMCENKFKKVTAKSYSKKRLADAGSDVSCFFSVIHHILRLVLSHLHF